LLLLRLSLLELPLLKLTFHALSELFAFGDPDQTEEKVSRVDKGKRILQGSIPRLSCLFMNRPC